MENIKVIIFAMINIIENICKHFLKNFRSGVDILTTSELEKHYKIFI